MPYLYHNRAINILVIMTYPVVDTKPFAKRATPDGFQEQTLWLGMLRMATDGREKAKLGKFKPPLIPCRHLQECCGTGGRALCWTGTGTSSLCLRRHLQQLFISYYPVGPATDCIKHIREQLEYSSFGQDTIY